MTMSATSEDLYEILGVSEDSDDAALKDAFRRLSRELHPDRFVGDTDKQEEVQARFAKISGAYNVLKDPEQRSEYDFTRRMLGNTQAAPAAAPNTDFRNSRAKSCYNAAMALQAEGEIGKAIESAKEAISLDGQEATYRTLLAALYARKGWSSYAKAELDVALRLNPDDEAAQKLMRRLQREAQEAEAAQGDERPSKVRGKKPKRRPDVEVKGVRSLKRRRKTLWQLLFGWMSRRKAR
ncbi:MAG: DnaJ domain-containing protein [Candidatus Sericytochromatia bacterium]|nr:DnaJ domain-containing protein [Candidatus Tanganyikabacteria bacterium]